MGIYAVKPKFQKKLRPLENLFVRYKIHPTIINLLGFVFSILSAAIIVHSKNASYLLLLLPVTTTFRTACNALDGLVSRRLGVASTSGEVYNELIDRISDLAIFFSIISLPVSNNTLGFVAAIMVLLNSYLGILSKAAGAARQYGGLMGKADRMIYLSAFGVAIAVLDKPHWWNGFLWFVLAGTFITFIQRFRTTLAELKTKR